LREGLDLPEVSLVVILDADKEGFLRSETSLIQTCGRAARNVQGRVVMYADKLTKSIQSAVATTGRRRELQKAYNEKHGITPTSAKREKIETLLASFGDVLPEAKEEKPQRLSKEELAEKIARCEKEMRQAAKELRFEEAAALRDELKQYQELYLLEDEL
jgi:excinuclease ABC subunit B